MNKWIALILHRLVMRQNDIHTPMENAYECTQAAHTHYKASFLFIGWREGGAVVCFSCQIFSGQSLSSLEGSGDFSSLCTHPTPIPLLGPGKLSVWVSFQQCQPNPVFLSPESLMDDSALPQSPGMSLGLLSQPEPCCPLVPTSPATLPPHPAALTHFCHPHYGVGLWLNWKKKKKNQPVIWNLNETKFISLCCHFIFHRFDSEGTGDPRGPFCFAHRVGRQEKEGGSNWQTGGNHAPSINLPAHTKTKVGEDSPFLCDPRWEADAGGWRRTFPQVKEELRPKQGGKGGAPLSAKLAPVLKYK